MFANHPLFLIDLHIMAPQDSKTKSKPSTSVHRFKAAIFHTMDFKLSLEVNNDQITPSTKRSILI